MSDRYDLVVLGGGIAGLVSAMIAAGAGARVALIERERTEEGILDGARRDAPGDRVPGR